MLHCIVNKIYIYIIHLEDAFIQSDIDCILRYAFTFSVLDDI